MAKGYGKKPWWFWVLAYIVVGAVIYAAVWYLFLKGQTGYSPY